MNQMKPNVRVIFLIGKNDETTKQSASKIQAFDRLNKEMDDYCDILQGLWYLSNIWLLISIKKLSQLHFKL